VGAEVPRRQHVRRLPVVAALLVLGPPGRLCHRDRIAAVGDPCIFDGGT
jgi:hypothetical protein